MPMILEGWGRKVFSPITITHDRIGSPRCFGVELEYQEVSPDYEDMERHTSFGAKNDCSLDSGGEFDSPILYGDQGLEECEKFCNLTNSAFDTGIGAGYHLHLDMRAETCEGIKRIALAYHYTKDFWLSLVPHSRRNFTYCRPHEYKRCDTLSIADEESRNNFVYQCDKYEWCNWSAYFNHKTVEIRCHHATRDAREITNWAIAHTRFCDAMADISVGRITRLFASKDAKHTMREMRAILRAPEVSEHLANLNRKFA